MQTLYSQFFFNMLLANVEEIHRSDPLDKSLEAFDIASQYNKPSAIPRNALKYQDLNLRNKPVSLDNLHMIYGRMKVDTQIIAAGKIYDAICLPLITNDFTEKNDERNRTKKIESKVATFAVALCANAISHVERIWANELELLANFDYKIYCGTNDEKLDKFLIEHFSSISFDDDPLTIGELRSKNASKKLKELKKSKKHILSGIAYIVFNNLELSVFRGEIPNICAEVVGRSDIAPNLENDLRCVNFSLRCDEYCAEPTVLYHEKLGILERKQHRLINCNTNGRIPDVVKSIEHMGSVFRNLKEVVLDVYYAIRIDDGKLMIRPCYADKNKSIAADVHTEFNQEHFKWMVDKYQHNDSIEVPCINNYPIYPCTPDDVSLVRLFYYFQSKGYNTIIRPRLIYILNEDGDVPNIEKSLKLQIANRTLAIDGEYAAMIYHCAELLKEKAFAIVVGADISRNIEDDDTLMNKIQEITNVAMKKGKMRGIIAYDLENLAENDDKGIYNIYNLRDHDIMLMTTLESNAEACTKNDRDEAWRWRMRSVLNKLISNEANLERKIYITIAATSQDLPDNSNIEARNKNNIIDAFCDRRIYNMNAMYQKDFSRSGNQHYSNFYLQRMRLGLLYEELLDIKNNAGTIDAHSNSKYLENIVICLETWDAKPYPDFQSLSFEKDDRVKYAHLLQWNDGYNIEGKISSTSLKSLLIDIIKMRDKRNTEIEWDGDKINSPSLEGLLFDANQREELINLLMEIYDISLKSRDIGIKPLNKIGNYIENKDKMSDIDRNISSELFLSLKNELFKAKNLLEKRYDIEPITIDARDIIREYTFGSERYKVNKWLSFSQEAKIRNRIQIEFISNDGSYTREFVSEERLSIAETCDRIFIPMMLSKKEARKILNLLIKKRKMRDTRYSFYLGLHYCFLRPYDIILLALPEKKIYSQISKVELGNNFLMRVECRGNLNIDHYKQYTDQ